MINKAVCVVIAGCFAVAQAGFPAEASTHDSGLRLTITACHTQIRTVHFQIYAHGTALRPRDDLWTVSRARSSTKFVTSFLLPEGGYQIGIFDGRCKAELHFGVLANRVRSYAVTMKPYSTRPVSRDDDFIATAGMVAGAARGKRITLEGRPFGRRTVFIPVVEGGAYYFDNVPEGKYRLIEVTGSSQCMRDVNVPANFELARVDML